MTALNRLPRTDQVDEMDRTALTFVMKAARVASYLDLGGDPACQSWGADVVPTLLLLERLIQRVRDGLPRLDEDDEGAGRALGRIAGILNPLIAAVDPRAKKVLAQLVAHQAAPSPFCILGASGQPPQATAATSRSEAADNC